MKRSANTQLTSGLAKSTAQRPTFCWVAKNSRTVSRRATIGVACNCSTFCEQRWTYVINNNKNSITRLQHNGQPPAIIPLNCWHSNLHVLIVLHQHFVMSSFYQDYVYNFYACRQRSVFLILQMTFSSELSFCWCCVICENIMHIAVVVTIQHSRWYCAVTM
jgi:hypothetical protein